MNLKIGKMNFHGKRVKNMKMTLWKKKYFVNEILYISSKGHISSTLLGILDSLKFDSDILVEDEVLIEFMNLIKTILPNMSFHSVETNADFNFHPFPKDFVENNRVWFNIASFVSSEGNYKKITQLAFKYNNLFIRIGTKI